MRYGYSAVSADVFFKVTKSLYTAPVLSRITHHENHCFFHTSDYPTAKTDSNRLVENNRLEGRRQGIG